jgi:hypothetical protein
MSAARDATITAVTLARNYIAYGVAVNGAAIEGIEVYAPPGDIVSGPLALTSAVQVVGWQAQYAQAMGYILRALTNSQFSPD